MPEREPLCIVDITSGLVTKLLTYLEAMANDLGNPPGLASARYVLGYPSGPGSCGCS